MEGSSKVWMNGGLVAADEVRVSPFDLGLTVGLGVFETMAAYQGRVFASELHYQRLRQSAAALGIVPPEKGEIDEAMLEVIEANGLARGRARIRVSVSGGANPLQGGENRGMVWVTAVPMAAPAESASLVMVPFPVNESAPTTGAKSASYADHLLAYRYALAAGADEAVRLNTRGQLCECAMSNLFLVSDGGVRTPALSSGCLAGVTRGRVIDLCRERGISVDEVDLDEDDLHEAEELFITSTAREVQAAKMVGDERAPGGPVTAVLAQAFRELVISESGL